MSNKMKTHIIYNYFTFISLIFCLHFNMITNLVIIVNIFTSFCSMDSNELEYLKNGSVFKICKF